MNIPKAFTTCALLAIPFTLPAVTIADSVADLSWENGGGGTNSGMSFSVTDDTLFVDVAKNRAISGALGSTYALTQAGDFIQVELSFQFNDPVASSGGSLYFGFSTPFDASTNYGQYGSIPPNGGSNGQIADILEAKISSNVSWENPSNLVNDVIFRIEKTVDGFTLSFSMDTPTTPTNTISSVSTDQNDANWPVAGLSTDSYSKFFIETRGNPMGQTDLTMDVTNMLITTNVPEPGFYAALAGALALGFVVLRKRK